MAKDKHKDRHGKEPAKGQAKGHAAGSADGTHPVTAGVAPSAVDAVSLPATRAELLALHAQTRTRRNAAVLGSAEHRAAVELIARIEVEIARIERAMDPPLV